MEDRQKTPAKRDMEDKTVDRDRKMTPQLTKAFLADLEFVFETDASDDMPIGDLNDLAERLVQWRKHCDDELKVELSKLEKDHPVCCPISLYTVMEMGRLEVAHTRTLAWMLDRGGEHGFGDTLLKAFLTHICDCGDLSSFDVCQVDAERVYRNSLAGDVGRTDIWIEGTATNSKPRLVVIEAKIDASEGEQQLYRYNGEIQNWLETHHDGEIHLVFLTPNGRAPASGLGWKPVSFSLLARVFWMAASSLKAQPGYHFLRYYLAGVLKEVLGLPIGSTNGHRNPYKLLEFLREPHTTNVKEA